MLQVAKLMEYQPSPYISFFPELPCGSGNTVQFKGTQTSNPQKKTTPPPAKKELKNHGGGLLQKLWLTIISSFMLMYRISFVSTLTLLDSLSKNNFISSYSTLLIVHSHHNHHHHHLVHKIIEEDQQHHQFKYKKPFSQHEFNM